MADPTYNEILQDAMVGHQIGLLQFSGSVRNGIWELLDATESDIVATVLRRAGRAGLTSPTRLNALRSMLEELREIRNDGWRQVRPEWFEEMRKFAVAEAAFFDGIIKSSASGVILDTVLPAPEVLRNIVTSQPFMGRVLKGWADNLQQRDLQRIRDQINIGLVQGEAPREISRRIVGTVRQNGRDGVTQITRNQAATVARTATNAIGAEARRKYAELNKDIAPTEVFVATLDSRTTPICRSLDGKVFAVDDPNAPVLPLHWGERSLYSPVLDADDIAERPRRDFTQRSLLRDYTAREGLQPVTTRAKLPRGTKLAFDAFARQRMRELTGIAPAKLTYTQWLRQQSAAIQDDILGPTRGALFRRGGLELDQFVMRDGTELTLGQLAERHREAFRRANVDAAA